MEWRIGIHIGDVLIEGDDILGDGVNIAARLESIAEPGRICISEDAYRQVRGKVEAEFADLGEQSLKNIARPLRVYRVGWSAKQPITSPVALPLPNKPSVAVLPFANMSSDPEQEFFADGISEDIITALSRYPSLFVIARNSSFTYKGRAVDVKQVGRDLGVRYVLEGSLRRAGNRIRVTAQLVEAETGNHVWAERYDRDLADIFVVQDEISEAVTIISEHCLGPSEGWFGIDEPVLLPEGCEPRDKGLAVVQPFELAGFLAMLVRPSSAVLGFLDGTDKPRRLDRLVAGRPEERQAGDLRRGGAWEPSPARREPYSPSTAPP